MDHSTSALVRHPTLQNEPRCTRRVAEVAAEKLNNLPTVRSEFHDATATSALNSIAANGCKHVRAPAARFSVRNRRSCTLKVANTQQTLAQRFATKSDYG